MSDYYFRFNRFLERHMPRGLYYRSLIIVIAPSCCCKQSWRGILDRHWDNCHEGIGVLAREIGMLTDLYDRSDKSEVAIKEIEFVATKRPNSAGKTRGDQLPEPINRTLFRSLITDDEISGVKRASVLD
jgi:two-component system osmolarity sensor histidine kinase EnvZ